LRHRFGFRAVAYTLREGQSSSGHRLGGLLCDARGCDLSQVYDLQIVDRIGGDDSNEPSKVGKGDIGCRTAACLEWPGRVRQLLRTNVPTVHTDMLPTVLAAAGVAYPDQRPLDGINLLPLLDGQMKERPKPIGFMEWRNRGKVAKQFADKTLKDIDFVAGTEGKWIDGSHMLYVNQPGPVSADGDSLFLRSNDNLYCVGKK
jgi:arylsulfatase A-like enzyme